MGLDLRLANLPRYSQGSSANETIWGRAGTEATANPLPATKAKALRRAGCFLTAR